MYQKLSTAVWHGKRDPWCKAKCGFYVTRSKDGYDYCPVGQGMIDTEDMVVARFAWNYSRWVERRVADAEVQRLVARHPELRTDPDVGRKLEQGLTYVPGEGWQL